MTTAVPFLLSLVLVLTNGQYYYQGLMDYLENRFLAIEDRMLIWHEQSNRYNTELRHFKKQTAEFIKGLNQDHGTLRQDLEGTGVRVDRVEREMDYIETQNPAKPCVNQADRMVDVDLEVKERVKERKRGGEEDGYSRVLDCIDIISSIRAMKILKRMGSPKGMWTKDARTSKVYVFNGTAEDTVYQFSSVLDFSSYPGVAHSRPIRLPSLWSGTGCAVYNGYAYYVMEGADELQVIKYDLANGTLADSAVFPVEVADHRPVYSLNPETAVDLAADEEGLWALYTTRESESINLAKMDPDSLDIEQMWDTQCPQENAEAAFVVCGTVYVVYNTRVPSRSRVQCVFDVNDAVTNEEAPLLYFPRRYGLHASLKYNPQEKQIYAWDDGYLILYKLSMTRKLMV
ncbi:olfactomedin-like protein 3B [Oncorhynchus mykiss]|uniref:Olfactomedin-like 3a n=1 Tax=Oncorhynchus mykiss TaxID=8022 RepID=A0A8C7PKD6_ONCMY|nr:olfactomedin-like protein 3B [Oncorhynchus mykiss]